MKSAPAVGRSLLPNLSTDFPINCTCSAAICEPAETAREISLKVKIRLRRLSEARAASAFPFEEAESKDAHCRDTLARTSAPKVLESVKSRQRASESCSACARRSAATSDGSAAPDATMRTSEGPA